MTDSEPRIKRLRQALSLSQAAMGERIGLSQAAVSQMESGEHESGPVRILLDQIEAQLARGAVGRGSEEDAA